MKIQKSDIYFSISLISAIWFALTSSFWVYYMNLVLSFPFAVLSLLLWHRSKKTDNKLKRYKAIPFILILGTIVSLVALIILLVYG
ncbi:hypothetical protein [Reichenbachiella sp. MALMAid0571]|uniref:hypothetical protein n=1 Tax=Reichenbachiella sp. MALMAid0571 TaxID=3143939 RepID=UPI0032DE9ED7